MYKSSVCFIGKPMADPHLPLRLLLVFLGICNLIFSNAVAPATSRNLMHGQAQVVQPALGETNLVAGGAEKVKVHGGGRRRRRRRRRLEVKLNDYPGSGANNRHTPRPPFGRGCIDC